MSVKTQPLRDPNLSEEKGPVSAGKQADPQWAWAHSPDAQRPWNLPRAGHLYRRAAFGADWDALQQALADGPQRSVDKLLRPDAEAIAFNKTYDEFDASAAGSGSADGLRAWWLRRMIHTPYPLLEKMTLFWHNHFATSNAQVNSGLLMNQHVRLLREHALGNFKPLLEGVSHDPATLLSVGADSNRKALPNESYTRQLMSRFSLGDGNFTEQDIQEGARAFTGWLVLRNKLRYVPREHDGSAKRILGQEGAFDGDDVVRIVLEQPAAPRFLVQRLYRWLISETDPPGDALIAPLADAFASDYDIAKLVETMLRSNLFHSPAAYRQRIKCPVEFAVGIAKGLEGMVPTSQLGNDLASLGQALYNPPTVKGWIGGSYWIDGATLVGRSNLAQALLSGSDPYGKALDPEAVGRKHGHSTPEAVERFLLDLFLQGDVDAGVAEILFKTAAASGGNPSQRIRRFAHSVVTLPEFQLA